MRFVFAPSPFKGEGWDGGEMVEVSRVDFNVFTPTPALRLKEGGGNS
jgi:hypothetical protein